MDAYQTLDTMIQRRIDNELASISARLVSLFNELPEESEQRERIMHALEALNGWGCACGHVINGRKL